MLEISHLTITHIKDYKQIVCDLSLNVKSGEKLAIIGEEGTGKSTLLKLILSPSKIHDYTTVEGTIQNPFNKIGYLPQTLSEQERQQTVLEFLFKNSEDLFDYNAFYQSAALLDLDVKKLEDSNLHLGRLSGGERLKLQLAKLAGDNADLLLLDEPSSDLDLESQLALQKFIQTSAKTIIFISHDEAVLEKTATAILHLELIRHRQLARSNYFPGKYSDYLKYRKNSYQKQLNLAKNAKKAKQKRDEKIHRLHQAVQFKVRNTHDSSVGRLAAKKMKNILSLEKRYHKQDEHLPDFPEEMDNLSLSFNNIEPLDNKKCILSWNNENLLTGQNIDLKIFGRDKIVITGKNGIGKSCLLEKIYNTLQQDKNLSIGYMPQDYDNFLPKEMNAIDFLREVSTETDARTILGSLQFTRFETEHPTNELSGGQKAKLFLAHMALAKNHILILDEPTRHFSPTSQPIVRKLLSDFDGCIISVSHDKAFIQEVPKISYRLNEKFLEKQ